MPQEHILLVSILSAQVGIHSVAYAYPNVKIITSAMDKIVNDNYHIIPGVGNFGDRYFGTEPDDYSGTHKQWEDWELEIFFTGISQYSWLY